MPRTPGRRRLFRLPWRTTRTLDVDVDEELRFHIDMRTEELMVRQGLDHAAARAEALRQFGDVEDARQYIRAMDQHTETATRRRDLMQSVRQDLSHAARSLRRSPGFAAVVVIALAFGIGVNTAIFSVVNAVLLRPLPVPEPHQLVGFGDRTLVSTNTGGAPATDLFSYPLYVELRDRTKLVPALFASGFSSRLDVVVPDSARAAGDAGAEPERPVGRLVSGNYFSVLGVRAVVGRTITVDDDRSAGEGPVAVISHAYWRRRFAQDPAVVGRTIRVNRAPITIIGVGPEGFAGEIVGRATDIWMPLSVQPLIVPNEDWLRDRNTNWLLLMGRLRPGATVAQVKAEFTQLAREAIANGADAAPPGATGGSVVEAYGAARGFVGVRRGLTTALLTLLALTGVILLVVSANVANLLLARAAARRTEISVRLALGAGRTRIVRLLMSESILLGVAAGALALWVVDVGSALLIRQATADGGFIPPGVAPDARVLTFAAMLSLCIAVLLGLAPALHATRGDLGTSLRSHTRGMSGDALSGGRFGLGKLLVMGQVALSLVLLTGAGLLVRSARNLGNIDVGLARDELLMLPVQARLSGYEGERLHVLNGQLVERLQQLPGVRSVTYSQNGIFSGIESSATLQVEGFVARADSDTSAFSDQVGPRYFQTIGARIVRGRDIDERDGARAPRVAVINETMARFYFGAQDPIGRSLRIDDTRYEIVGVVADIVGQSLRDDRTRRFYTALAQGGGAGTIVFAVRTVGDPAQHAAAARREILAADPLLRLKAPLTVAVLVQESIASERLMARLAGIAGAVALALTALGLYGVMTYAIVRRTKEFGLRMALGAQAADLTRMVLRETLILVLFGAAVGIPAALGAARLMRSQLVGVGLVDLPTLAIALALLGAIAALAAYRPARRAAMVAPHVALGQD